MHVSILYIFFLFKIAYYGIFMIDSLGGVGFFFFPVGQIGSSEALFPNEMCRKKGALQVPGEVNAFLSTLAQLVIPGTV